VSRQAGPFTAWIRTPWNGPWRVFTAPERVLLATRPEDVPPCLHAVDAARRAGYFAAGFVAYEAGAAFGLAARDPGELPCACFGIFAPPQVRTSPEGPPSDPGDSPLRAEDAAYAPSVDRAAYSDAIRQIKREIESGNTYQINFTFSMRAAFDAEPRELFRRLQRAQAGAWAAYVDTGRHAICSASPELFFKTEEGAIECRPMKGTAPRGRFPAEDERQRARLQASAKNRAENVMIVDLVRNDLGKIARTGSVRVRSLFDTERYPGLWQMTSTVQADAPGATLGEIFGALFPSGSVTGAPKHRSMQIIRALEPEPRGVYTGAIGYAAPDGRAHFNVAIRTVVIDRERRRAAFGVGSGIVWDSVDRDEYDECLLKAAMLARPVEPFELLETIGWDPTGGFRLLPEHLRRLRASAEYFGFACDEEGVRTALESAIGGAEHPLKLRLLLGASGCVRCEAQAPEPWPDRPLRVALAPDPVDPRDRFLFHKTTIRAVYDHARASAPDADAVLLVNTAGELTEGTDANLVLEIAGRKLTPALECGLLPGTLRASLLEAGAIAEARLTPVDLRRASRAWLINSVRGWGEVGG
jgi:para-aminobenzoate synthetase / 4-amino-4-deoxychorismate lyase